VELELAHDVRRAADVVYLLLGGGDDYVALRGAHRVATLRGDHARLNTPFRDGGRDTLPDALREVEPAGPFHQALNLSKKRAK
jgi:hypothetical protein